jgi:hypothetical protein
MVDTTHTRLISHLWIGLCPIFLVFFVAAFATVEYCSTVVLRVVKKDHYTPSLVRIRKKEIPQRQAQAFRQYARMTG